MDLIVLEAMLKSFAMILMLMAIVPIILFAPAVFFGVLLVGIVKLVSFIAKRVRRSKN